ncbi:hypothetical protein NPX13_g8054 [Xylaria arbuscula]|uniref:Uncharacterized protein n=1 Tax=Xylaria arbuscula TaxID=114810 RepID=A0A9W8N944_9PEZI|nr:hypothetical protein NPX13_g8054 [Xylaria arbuscula]
MPLFRHILANLQLSGPAKSILSGRFRRRDKEGDFNSCRLSGQSRSQEAKELAKTHVLSIDIMRSMPDIASRNVGSTMPAIPYQAGFFSLLKRHPTLGESLTMVKLL